MDQVGNKPSSEIIEIFDQRTSITGYAHSSVVQIMCMHATESFYINHKVLICLSIHMTCAFYCIYRVSTRACPHDLRKRYIALYIVLIIDAYFIFKHVMRLQGSQAVGHHKISILCACKQKLLHTTGYPCSCIH